MQTSAKMRANKGQIVARLGAIVFVGTGLFLGALLAALAGI